ncbi:hypothetical protein PIB30_078657 [Stylosanthes scabra]|uniref:Uncharacterized protein n=1 Tax=Stylosanthes scabra TaxID=79078 RepID=A0ABU6TQI3_9FABA|nr:hypothetical protein [Stylosanthes scabra]
MLNQWNPSEVYSMEMVLLQDERGEWEIVYHHKRMLILEHKHHGSAQRTVKFWNLESFELIGSTRQEVVI